MILTGQLIRNSCLRYWINNQKASRNDLQKLCSVLAKDVNFPWAKKLNSQARQASADRAWQSIQRFYKNCRQNKPGKKGSKNSPVHRSNSKQYLGARLLPPAEELR
ncbi:hypothetical protein [Dapis sp. BLCC M229]|uniref:hypothetical protein n=1 Tax=Dapis sp. BLCC M229 TaxID=3400188 RepID=UPI003CEBDA1B